MTTKLDSSTVLEDREDFAAVMEGKTFDEIVSEFSEQNRMNDLILYMFGEIQSLSEMVDQLVDIVSLQALQDVSSYLDLEPDLLDNKPPKQTPLQ